MPNHYVGDLQHTMAISGLSRVRTELFQLLVVPSLAPHPVQTDRKFTGHGYFGDAPFPSHGQVEKMPAPVGFRAHRGLGRLHQQEAQQRVALLADVSQSPSIATGLLRWHQPHIASDLLAAVKTFRWKPGSPCCGRRARRSGKSRRVPQKVPEVAGGRKRSCSVIG
jgi:hypothetical protein